MHEEARQLDDGIGDTLISIRDGTGVHIEPITLRGMPAIVIAAARKTRASAAIVP
jgi:hypothetical protein